MVKLRVWDIRTGHEEEGTYGSYWSDNPNSADGVSVCFSFTNLTGKTIKYANFWFVPYNRVNDPVSCEITGKSRNGVRYTGPLSPYGSYEGAIFTNAWYNRTITRVKLLEVYVEYMDGSSEVILPYEMEIEFYSAPVYTNTSSGGCYVATAVYGSYDCPQVWTLRRYRDYTLAATWYGRLFIKTYYAISPTLVKWFGHTKWFKKMWKGKLDRMVAKLQSEGVASSPYEDKEW